MKKSVSMALLALSLVSSIEVRAVESSTSANDPCPIRRAEAARKKALEAKKQKQTSTQTQARN